MNIYTYFIRYCGADGTHDDITCDDGQIVIVNYAATEDTWLWQCGDDDGRCPGAFQVGCEPDDDYTTTTTTTTIDPDAPGMPFLALTLDLIKLFQSGYSLDVIPFILSIYFLKLSRRGMQPEQNASRMEAG